MKLLKHYTINDVSGDYSHNWFAVVPYINIQHKYWYLWKVNFGWFYFDKMIEIVDDNWNKQTN